MRLPMERLILIKYGELTTKKANRKLFINILERNIRSVLEGQYTITKDRVRMYIKSDNIDDIAQKLQLVFGIHGIVICHKVNNNIEEIKEKSVEILKKLNFQTFKIETKRADKNFPIPSLQFSSDMGGEILKQIPCHVDVHHPDITLQIEIRPEGTFLYTNEIKGSGGYPVGVQGKGLLMLSGGIDSPVAGYLALKRGVSLECLYFESPPHTSIEAKNKVRKLTQILNQYAGNVRLHVVPFTKLQEAIYKNVPNNYMITIMRRMMYRIAEKYAHRQKCKIIINGESIGQVASQTLSSIAVINEVIKMPVIRPVATYDKLEIIELAKKIETYETSILPFEDCCTIFLPKHPVIEPNLNACIEAEKTFDFEFLIEECLDHIEIISVLEENKNTLL